MTGNPEPISHVTVELPVRSQALRYFSIIYLKSWFTWFGFCTNTVLKIAAVLWEKCAFQGLLCGVRAFLCELLPTWYTL